MRLIATNRLFIQKAASYCVQITKVNVLRTLSKFRTNRKEYPFPDFEHLLAPICMGVGVLIVKS